VGPRIALDAVVKIKIPSPSRESNSRTPIVQPVAQSLYRLRYQGSSAVLGTEIIFNPVKFMMMMMMASYRPIKCKMVILS
jgi:hypothetical protein